MLRLTTTLTELTPSLAIKKTGVSKLTAYFLAATLSACTLPKADTSESTANRISDSVVARNGDNNTAQDGGEGSGHRIIVDQGPVINPIIQDGSGNTVNTDLHLHLGGHYTVTGGTHIGLNRGNSVLTGTTNYFSQTYRERMVRISNENANSPYSTQRSLLFIDAFLEALDKIDNNQGQNLSPDALVHQFNVTDPELLSLCRLITSDLASRKPNANITGVNHYCTQVGTIR